MASLADYIWSLLAADRQNLLVPDEEVTIVVDGGSPFHRLPWQYDSTYDQLISMYEEFLT